MGIENKKLRRIAVSNLKSARAAGVRVLNEYRQGIINEKQSNTMIYSLNFILACLKTINEVDLEKRIEALEFKQKNIT